MTGALSALMAIAGFGVSGFALYQYARIIGDEDRFSEDRIGEVIAWMLVALVPGPLLITAAFTSWIAVLPRGS